jgi:primosomal replication protein N
VNRLLLSGSVQERGALRYTPAGLPALDLVLRHESQVEQAGQPRQISMEVKALAIGDIVTPLAQLPLGQAARFAGFLAAARNGRGLLFHLTEMAPDDQVPDAPAVTL